MAKYFNRLVVCLSFILLVLLILPQVFPRNEVDFTLVENIEEEANEAASLVKEFVEKHKRAPNSLKELSNTTGFDDFSNSFLFVNDASTNILLRHKSNYPMIPAGTPLPPRYRTFSGHIPESYAIIDFSGYFDLIPIEKSAD